VARIKFIVLENGQDGECTPLGQNEKETMPRQNFASTF
jgi:hypothetical protein